MHPQSERRATKDSFQSGKARRAKPAIGPQVFHTQHCEHNSAQNRARATQLSFWVLNGNSIKAEVSSWLPTTRRSLTSENADVRAKRKWRFTARHVVPPELQVPRALRELPQAYPVFRRLPGAPRELAR